MNFFFILQVLFDAILLFGILFLFHYSVHQSQRKSEESDILKNVQVQEMKENLQELLLTLKQLGKEVSDNIQEQVKEAEEKSDAFKKTLVKLQKDLSKALRLAHELDIEKERLEHKLNVIQSAKKTTQNPSSENKKLFLRETSSDLDSTNIPETGSFKIEKRSRNIPGRSAVGFSSGLVKEVYRLADSNLGLNEIVQKTQLSRAEVQLIINLRDNRFTTPN
jgi:hypothetical protein